MRILLLGGTGFVGHALNTALRSAGHTTFLCTRRRPPKASPAPAHQGGLVQWDGVDAPSLRVLLAGMDAVINLQGENIGASRWTEPRRRVLLQSRLAAGHAITQALADMHKAGEALPHTVLQASACGYYGLWQHNAPLCPEDSPSGAGFLASTCVQWEASTAAVEQVGVRRCVLRLSPVLGRDAHGAPGGFVQRMAAPFAYYVGGPLGAGHQPVSWVHVDDVCGAALFLLDRPALHGVFNVCAPQCPDMNAFAQCLGRVLQKPALLRVPAFVLRLALGHMAEELVLAGQHPVPARLTASGYDWQWPALEAALRDVFYARS